MIELGDDVDVKFIIVGDLIVIINFIDYDIGDIIYIFIIVGIDSLICDFCRIGIMIVEVNIEFVNEFVLII